MELQHFLQDPLHFQVSLGKDTAALKEWEKEIPDLIDKADIFIAIIGKRWAKPNASDSKRDIHNPNDVVRREVERGLKKKNRCGVIVLDSAKPKADMLPKELHGLLDVQWTFSPRKFEIVESVGRLIAQMFALRPKPIVLLSSTLAFLGNSITTDGLTYFVTLVVSLVHKLMTEHEVILKVPPYGDEAATKNAADFQCELLKQIIEESDQYSGLIIAPFETESLQESLHRLWKIAPEYPVATIDKVYDQDDKYFLKRGSVPPPGVACDGKHNGDLAAQCVIDYLKHARVTNPNVVVLQGLEGSKLRISGFIERVKTYNASAPADAKIYLNISKATPFLGEDARKKAESYLRSKDDWDTLSDVNYRDDLKGQPEPQRSIIDAFFCCNDEMALGVCEELEYVFRTHGILNPTVVVGFDGIPEANRRITNQSHWLLNSIDVNLHKQVNELLKHFAPAVKAGTRVQNLGLVPGKKVNDDQYKHIEAILAWRRQEKERIYGS